MNKLMKKILLSFCVQCGVFPIECTDLDKWKNFAENSPRRMVERGYRFWKLVSDLYEENGQKVEEILLGRLKSFEKPIIGAEFINAYKDEIAKFPSDWDAKTMFEYIEWVGYSPEYPFYVVDENNQLRGIAVEKGFVFAGTFNFNTLISEVGDFYQKNQIKPLTQSEAKLLEERMAKINKMMKAVGMSPINGCYLVTDDECRVWLGMRLNCKNALLSGRYSKEYFLLAKL